MRCFGILLASLFLLGNAISACAAAETDDAAVISLCIASEIAAIEDGITGQLQKGVIFIDRPGEADRSMMAKPQLVEDLEDALSAPLESLFNASLDRDKAGWKAPPGIKVSGHAVKYALPPVETSYIADTSFLFWPPGYSIADDQAIVRGLFTPSIDGATLTCHLEKTNGKWRVVKSWLRTYR